MTLFDPKPAGTLMFGASIISQFGYELKLLDVRKPVVVTIDAYRRKALKAAALLARQSKGIVVAGEPAGDDDFLLLAGGKTIMDRWVDDPRPKAWLMLDNNDLHDFREPQSDFTVIDSRFIRDKSAVRDFMKKFAFSVSGGMVSDHPGNLAVPSAFTYSCRTKVISGNNSLERLSGLLAGKGGSRGMKYPMVLIDRGIKAVGLFSILEEVLGEAKYEVFDDIPPDSGSITVNEISRLYKEKGCDGIIAMGGGSVLDTGKGVFLNVSLDRDDLVGMAGSNIIPRLDTPFIAVPTTSGTGSEVTKVAVISDAERNRKILYVSPWLMPDYGILDSRLTRSLPPHLTSITGVDALSHAVEAYTCMGKNPISDQMAWKAVELIKDNLAAVISDPQNPELRLNLALASNLAGQAFSNSMVGMVHTIGHSVGAVCHAPHGSCMSVLLPVALEYNYSEISSLLAELFPAVAETGVIENTPAEDRARGTIECIRGLNSKLKELTGGIHPVKLSEITGRDGEPLVKKSDFNRIAEISLGDASIVYNPVELRLNDIIGVLEQSY